MQLLLDLSIPQTFEVNDYVVGPCNFDAYTWVQRWPEWPTRAMAVYGSSSCGKTHLGHIWQKKSDAIFVEANQLPSPNTIIPHQAVVLEGSPANEEKYLHFYNTIIENKGWLLLLDHQPPAWWYLTLPDLKSRMLAVPAFEISPPDDTVMKAVLLKLLSDKQIKVRNEDIDYIVPRVERSFSGIQNLVNSIEKTVASQKRGVTLHMLRNIL